MKLLNLLVLMLALASCHEQVCDDGDACTTDSWNEEVQECQYRMLECQQPADSCYVAFCSNGLCDTIFVCTLPDTCDDADNCTWDYVDSLTGYCIFELISCADPDLCTNDFCVAGVCINAPYNCNDGDSTTFNDRCENGWCVYDDSLGITRKRIEAEKWIL